jgi:Ca2+-binding RTX toxin-like protein
MRQRTARRAIWLGISTMGLLALVSAGALASTVHTRVQRVWYTAAPGEVNNLTISLTGTDFRLSDPGATITAMPACTAFGSAATCSSASIRGITVSGGDGADAVVNTTATRSTLSGGDGNDSLEGGTGEDILRGNQGVDTHTGGLGNDLIDARGDRGDIVSCGDGMDTVRADISDSVALDCETVDRGVPLPVPPTDPGQAPLSPAAGALLGPAETRTLDPGACSQDKLGTASNDRLAGSGFGDNLFASRATMSSEAARAMTVSSEESAMTAWREREGTTACLETTAARVSAAMTACPATPATTCCRAGPDAIG